MPDTMKFYMDTNKISNPQVKPGPSVFVGPVEVCYTGPGGLYIEKKTGAQVQSPYGKEMQELMGEL